MNTGYFAQCIKKGVYNQGTFFPLYFHKDCRPDTRMTRTGRFVQQCQHLYGGLWQVVTGNVRDCINFRLECFRENFVPKDNPVNNLDLPKAACALSAPELEQHKRRITVYKLKQQIAEAQGKLSEMGVN